MTTGTTAEGLDVSRLPGHAFGARAPLWWGVLLLVVIESTSMALLLVSYFYLRGGASDWPAHRFGGTTLTLAAVELALLIASYPAMMAAVRAARRQQVAPTRR